MAKGSEVVWDPLKRQWVAVASVHIRDRKPFLRQQNPATFSGNEAPRLAESRAAFAEINYNAFGRKRPPSGDFPQWDALREKSRVHPYLPKPACVQGRRAAVLPELPRGEQGRREAA